MWKKYRAMIMAERDSMCKIQAKTEIGRNFKKEVEER